VVVQPASGDSFGWLLVDGAVVAATAVGAPVTPDVLPGLFGVLIVMGAAWGLLLPELREEMMLGDTGANPIGAAIGLAVVLTQSQLVRVGVLVMLVVLNLASERVSFSSVIDRVGPLRFVDRLGRRPSGS
jgi:hypothetical protein